MQFCKPSKAVENNGFVTYSPGLVPYRDPLLQPVGRKECREMTQKLRHSSTPTKECSCGMKLEGVPMTTTQFSNSDNTHCQT